MMDAGFRNPFRPGAGHMPPYLAGRDGESGEFQKLLGQDVILDNMILTGIRGVGKTVLMDTWRPLALGRGWRWAGNDLSEASRLSGEALGNRLMVDLAVALSPLALGERQGRGVGLTRDRQPAPHRLDYDALRGVWDAAPGLTSDKLRAVLEAAWGAVKDFGVRGVIFAYDEAQNLTNGGKGQEYSPAALLLDVFQSVQKKGVPFMLVLSGLPTLFPGLVEARTFAERMFRVVTLNRLDAHSCRDAIVKPVEAAADCPVTFTEESVSLLYQVTAGYPYFVQFFCREVFDVWAVNSGAAVPLDDIQRKLDADFFAGRWYRTTDRQRDLLRVVAGLENSSEEFSVQDVVNASKGLKRRFSASHVAQILSALGDSGFVYRNRRGRYSLAVPLLDGFIRRQE